MTPPFQVPFGELDLLTVDELLRVEELAVGAAPSLVNHGRLQVNEDSPGG